MVSGRHAGSRASVRLWSVNASATPEPVLKPNPQSNVIDSPTAACADSCSAVHADKKTPPATDMAFC